MKYSLIYHDKWTTLAIGEYDTYDEALLAMFEVRKWAYPSTTKVRFEIREDQYYG